MIGIDTTQRDDFIDGGTNIEILVCSHRSH